MEMRGIEPRAFHMQSKRSTTELHPLTFGMAKFCFPINLFHFLIEQIMHACFQSKIESFTRGETRTRNLRFRRPTPYPLGHAGCDNVLNLFKFLHSNWECHPNEILHIRELQWASSFRSLESFSKGLCKSKGALLPSVVQSTAQIILFRIYISWPKSQERVKGKIWWHRCPPGPSLEMVSSPDMNIRGGNL